MAASEPIDPRVRLAISQWPDDAPRGAVSTFCAEHGISRKSFYELRKRAKVDGPAAVLEPRSRRPRSSPSKLSDDVKAQAVKVRAALEASGLEHGPISVHDKMRAMGLDPVPSIPSLARIFREAGVARLEPKKKPRSAWRRFVYPAPNACWQLDATEYVLAGGRTCVILQLIDDHSRYAVASHVAWTETAEAAITVFDKAVAAHGVPQRLLSDNSLALNPTRRGIVGQLVNHCHRCPETSQRQDQHLRGPNVTGCCGWPVTANRRAAVGQSAVRLGGGYSRVRASAKLGKAKDARKMGRNRFPVHRNPIVWLSTTVKLCERLDLRPSRTCTV
jgi:transposase InsO family protein